MLNRKHVVKDLRFRTESGKSFSKQSPFKNTRETPERQNKFSPNKIQERRRRNQ